MYLLENFKDEIILTRVLSEEEVIKWGESSSDLGSSHDLFWHDSVHTSYFNSVSLKIPRFFIQLNKYMSV